MEIFSKFLGSLSHCHRGQFVGRDASTLTGSEHAFALCGGETVLASHVIPSSRAELGEVSRQSAVSEVMENFAPLPTETGEAGELKQDAATEVYRNAEHIYGPGIAREPREPECADARKHSLDHLLGHNCAMLAVRAKLVKSARSSAVSEVKIAMHD